MDLDHSAIEILITTMLAIIGALFAYFTMKLDKTLDGLATAINSLETSIEISNKRLDVTDLALSHIFKDPFNSEGIVKKTADWPRMFKQ